MKWLNLFLCSCLLFVNAYKAVEARSVVQEQSSRAVSDEPAPLDRYELIIKNRLPEPINIVYAKSLHMKNMSVNLLPFPIRPGKQGLVSLFDGKTSCEWVVLVKSNNYSLEKVVNVCNLSVLTVTAP